MVIMISTGHCSSVHEITVDQKPRSFATKCRTPMRRMSRTCMFDDEGGKMMRRSFTK